MADAKVRSFSSSEGYAELPYTLAQDSTLFLLMRERHPDIWFQKLDYIAEHGGMALVNVHPDYMRFGDEAPSPTTYLVEYYSRFLDYVRDEYKGAFWQPLPKEVAAWVSKHKPVARAPRRICMVTYLGFFLMRGSNGTRKPWRNEATMWMSSLCVAPRTNRPGRP